MNFANAKNVVQISTIALNGAFIGAMVLIGLVIAPFWQNTEPQSFLDWFTAYGSSIGNLMIPLGPGVLIFAVLAFFMSKENKLLWGLTIAFTLANILYFPLYFLPTNASFSEQTINIMGVSDELSTWVNFHWQRVLFAIAALVTSITAVINSKQ